MDTELVAEYAKIRRMEKAKGAEAAALKERGDAIEPQLIEALFAEGIDRITLDGTTVYLSTAVYAGKNPEVDIEDFHAALRTAGLEDFIRPSVNAQTLAAWAREMIDNDQPLPEVLDGRVKVSFVTKVKTTPAGAKKTRTAKLH